MELVSAIDANVAPQLVGWGPPPQTSVFRGVGGRSRTPLVYNAVEICYKTPGWPARLTKPREGPRTVWIYVTQRRTPMKIIQPRAVPAEPATSQLFTGAVIRQPMLTPEMRQHFN